MGFVCVGCQAWSGWRAFCAPCLSALIACPPLCSECGDLRCCIQGKGKCLRKWLSPGEDPPLSEPRVHSFSAAYLLTQATYRVLKYWKNHPNRALQQHLFHWRPALLDTWKQFTPEAVIPIPQTSLRSWKLGKNPAAVLAQKIAKDLHIPCLEPLAVGEEPHLRQAMLPAGERHERSRDWQLLQSLLTYRRLMLVDDFRTTGRTVQDALSTLNSVFSGQWHVFYLGVRPLMSAEAVSS